MIRIYDKSGGVYQFDEGDFSGEPHELITQITSPEDDRPVWVNVLLQGKEHVLRADHIALIELPR